MREFRLSGLNNALLLAVGFAIGQPAGAASTDFKVTKEGSHTVGVVRIPVNERNENARDFSGKIAEALNESLESGEEPQLEPLPETMGQPSENAVGDR